jgi:hypothetical protein
MIPPGEQGAAGKQDAVEEEYLVNPFDVLVLLPSPGLAGQEAGGVVGGPGREVTGKTHLHFQVC